MNQIPKTRSSRDLIRTSAIPLAAFLIARGHQPVSLVELTPRQREFEFERTPDIEAAVDLFFENASVPVRTYVAALSKARDLIRLPMPQGGRLTLGGRS